MELPEIPGYKYVRKIGEGGFCEVHLAEHETFHQKVAVKIPKTENYPIEYEAAVLEWLHSQNIAGIVPYYGLHQTNNGSALILGYAEETLEGMLKDFSGYMERGYGILYEGLEFSGKALQTTQILNSLTVFLNLAEIIKKINRKGLIHGDIKPNNILLHNQFKSPLSCEEGVTLCDFGFSTFFWENENSDYKLYLVNSLTNFIKERLPKNKYSYSLKNINTPLSYMAISLHTNMLEDRSLLFSKSVLEKSIALRGGTPSYQAPESLQGEFSGKEDQYALARIFEDILKWNKKRLNGLMIEAFKKENYDFEEDTCYTKPANSYLDKIIQFVEEKFLTYNPQKRPSFQDIQDFIKKTIDDSGGLGMYSKKERKFLKDIKVEKE